MGKVRRFQGPPSPSPQNGSLLLSGSTQNDATHKKTEIEERQKQTENRIIKAKIEAKTSEPKPSEQQNSTKQTNHEKAKSNRSRTGPVNALPL
jgi:hypothetical protein